jgi:transposase InsO family protein
VEHLRRIFPVSERRACKVLGQHRSTHRRVRTVTDIEKQIVEEIIAIRRLRPRYGYRRLTAELRSTGWRVNHKRIARICREHGLKILPIRRKRRYLGSADGGIVRLEAERPNHVWAVDFVHDRTADGRMVKILVVVDEYTRECLALKAARSIRAADVRDVLRSLCIERGMPEHVRSDNGPEFIADVLRRWIAGWGGQSSFIEPGSPWQNGYVESFNSRLNDELLASELIPSLAEARWLLERYRHDYNHGRRHSSLGYLTPAEFARSLDQAALTSAA